MRARSRLGPGLSGRVLGEGQPGSRTGVLGLGLLRGSLARVVNDFQLLNPLDTLHLVHRGRGPAAPVAGTLATLSGAAYQGEHTVMRMTLNGYNWSRMARAQFMHAAICKLTGLAGNPAQGNNSVLVRPETVAKEPDQQLEPNTMDINEQAVAAPGPDRPPSDAAAALPPSALPPALLRTDGGLTRPHSGQVQSASAADGQQSGDTVGQGAGGPNQAAPGAGEDSQCPPGNGAGGQGPGLPAEALAGWARRGGSGPQSLEQQPRVFTARQLWDSLPLSQAMQIIGSANEVPDLLARCEADACLGSLSHKEQGDLFDDSSKDRFSALLDLLRRMGLLELCTAKPGSSIPGSGAMEPQQPKLAPGMQQLPSREGVPVATGRPAITYFVAKPLGLLDDPFQDPEAAQAVLDTDGQAPSLLADPTELLAPSTDSATEATSSSFCARPPTSLYIRPSGQRNPGPAPPAAPMVVCAEAGSAADGATVQGGPATAESGQCVTSVAKGPPDLQARACTTAAAAAGGQEAAAAAAAAAADVAPTK
ncbi:hypothetical protein V8C86DRAFT_2455468, partial [Haematococcus lacustris]